MTDLNSTYDKPVNKNLTLNTTQTINSSQVVMWRSFSGSFFRTVFGLNSFYLKDIANFNKIKFNHKTVFKLLKFYSFFFLRTIENNLQQLSQDDLLLKSPFPGVPMVFFSKNVSLFGSVEKKYLWAKSFIRWNYCSRRA